VQNFQKNHQDSDILSITDPNFDKHFVQLTVNISKEEANIKHYIQKSFENMNSIEQKIRL
jgi:hypothetical protein